MNMFSPAEITKNYVAIGKGKVNTPIPKMLLLAVMAGAFIALGGVGATTAAVSIPMASVGKFVGACIFPGGLTMVLLAGSELFTGNCMLTIPLLEKEITAGGMLKNWIVVYTGNMIGGLLVAAGMVYSNQFGLFGNGMAVSAMSAAAGKCTLSFTQAFIKGIFCNFLVCLAVWIAFAAKDVAGKIIGLFFPIMIFVLCGFEHSVANMYYIGAGLFAKNVPEYAKAAAEVNVNMDAITWKGFFGANLLPVTLGNIVGGALCVGCVYWFLFLRKNKQAEKLGGNKDE